MLSLFFRFELEKIIKYFRTKTLAKLITSALFLGVFFFVGSGIYYFFLSGFRYINLESEVDSKLALALFLYEVFLIALAVVTALSAMVSGIFNLYRGSYNNWIVGTPSYTVFPKVVLLKSVLTSSLPFLVMFLPATLAFNKVYGLGILSLCVITLSVVFFLVTVNSLTLTLLLLVTHFYYKCAQKITSLQFSLKGLIGILILLATILTGFILAAVRKLDLVQVFKADIESETLSVTNIANYFSFLPTHPFASELLAWQTGATSDALGNLLVLALIMIVVLLFWQVLSPLYYPLWQKFQEGNYGSSSDAPSTSPLTGYIFSGGQTSVLFKKELLITSRNYKGLLWFLFLFSIWLLQIGTNSVLGFNIQKHQPDLTLKIAILQSLQFIIAIYFICSFSLRFVFPAFSVEKRTSWVLGSAPLSFKRIFFGKYFFYSTFFVLLGLLMSYINVSVLNLPTLAAFYLVTLFLITTVFIVTFALSFGAVFPSGESDDPEVVTTSMPGLFFTAFSLSYGALCAWSLYVALSTGEVVDLILVLLVTAALTVGLLLTTPRLVKRFANRA